MAYEIIGNVHKIGTTENIQTKSGNTFQRRSLTLIQRRFDQNTGEEFEPNFPTIDFTRDKCMELDKYKPGDRVRIRFDVSGAKYLDKNTGEEKYFNSLRGFRIEPFVQPNAQQQLPPQQGYAQQVQPQVPYAQPTYPPQGGYQQPAPVQQQQAPQQSREEDLPF